MPGMPHDDDKPIHRATIGGLVGDMHPVEAIQDCAQASADNRVVVEKHNADHGGLLELASWCVLRSQRDAGRNNRAFTRGRFNIYCAR